MISQLKLIGMGWWEFFGLLIFSNLNCDNYCIKETENKWNRIDKFREKNVANIRMEADGPISHNMQLCNSDHLSTSHYFKISLHFLFHFNFNLDTILQTYSSFFHVFVSFTFVSTHQFPP